MSIIKESLIENSKSAIIASIEIHNKPVFSYRYEVTTILVINAWELLLKAYIVENHKEVKIINKDGLSKPFEECLAFVSSQLGKDFRAIEENLQKIYEYRCHIIHFYKDNIDSILYSLIHKSIQFYDEFIKKFFNIDLAELTNLIILPIGFKPFASPVDFLSSDSDLSKSSNSVKEFIKSIVKSTENLEIEGVQESILTGFRIAVINENRITNADIIAGITNNSEASKLSITNVLSGMQFSRDSDAKKVNIEEETLFKTMYTLKYQDVVDKSKLIFTDFKKNANFNKIMGKDKARTPQKAVFRCCKQNRNRTRFLYSRRI
ncbi:DUF3644 domain-containing protein [Flavobacterium sp.]|jgi:hypothetical protein|uniref:DUF3644 domain-containing protein n=1 Tax=Flavobacterium sp. TaxID=239 RepID=UPI0037C03DE6